MIIQFEKNFKKNFKKLSKKIQEKFFERLKIFTEKIIIIAATGAEYFSPKFINLLYIKTGATIG